MKYYFRCPKCGNDEQFVKPAEQSGSFSGGFLGGGIIPSLAFADYAAIRYSTDTNHANRRALLISTLVVVVSSVVLLGTILCTLAPFVQGVLRATP